jgi:hypothetical protein
MGTSIIGMVGTVGYHTCFQIFMPIKVKKLTNTPVHRYTIWSMTSTFTKQKKTVPVNNKHLKVYFNNVSKKTPKNLKNLNLQLGQLENVKASKAP